MSTVYSRPAIFLIRNIFIINEKTIKIIVIVNKDFDDLNNR
jgi:hypothetical protein